MNCVKCKAELPPSALYCPACGKKQTSEKRKALKRANGMGTVYKLDKLGIERKTPHATRHTYASEARKNGMAPEILQKILGHADYSTTANIYVHTDIEELLAAVERDGEDVQVKALSEGDC